MLNEEEKLSSENRLNSLKEECNQINAGINKANEEKELHFKKKEELQKEINSLINNIRNVKTSTDGSSKGIRELKNQRDAYNKKTKELIAKIKDMRTKKESLIKKGTVDIRFIKKQMDNLEESIEINAYTYDKEQKVMDKIKKLKKIYKENEAVAKLDDELRSLSAEINTTKKMADEFHNKLDESIKGSKETGSTFMELAKKINLMKQEQKEEFEKFRENKLKYIDGLNKLKEKENEIRSLGSKMYSDKKEEENSGKRRETEELKRKIDMVKEKMKKEKKLTREDLLILQADESF